MCRARGTMSAERNKAMKSLSQLGRGQQPLNQRQTKPCASYLTTGIPTTRASTQPPRPKILQQDALTFAILVNLEAALVGRAVS